MEKEAATHRVHCRRRWADPMCELLCPPGAHPRPVRWSSASAWRRAASPAAAAAPSTSGRAARPGRRGGSGSSSRRPRRDRWPQHGAIPDRRQHRRGDGRVGGHLRVPLSRVFGVSRALSCQAQGGTLVAASMNLAALQSTVPRLDCSTTGVLVCRTADARVVDSRQLDQSSTLFYGQVA